MLGRGCPRARFTALFTEEEVPAPFNAKGGVKSCEMVDMLKGPKLPNKKKVKSRSKVGPGG